MTNEYCCPAPLCSRQFKRRNGLTVHEAKCAILCKLRQDAQMLRHQLKVPRRNASPLSRKARIESATSHSQQPPFDAMSLGDEDWTNTVPINTRPPTPPPQLTKSGRPRREYRMPRRFRDTVPEPPPPLPVAPALPAAPIRRVILHVLDRFDTITNVFGVWRHYPRRPNRDPDSCLSPADLANKSAVQYNLIQPLEMAVDSVARHLQCLSPAVRGLLKWLNNGQITKSYDQINELVNTVLLADDFDVKDLTGFDARRESLRLDRAMSESDLRSQFEESSVQIMLPSGLPDIPPTPYTVHGLLHRRLTSVITEAFTGPLAHLYHYSPFILKRISPNTHMEERLYAEIYNTDAFLEEHEHIQRHGLLPPDNMDCTREKVVAALMTLSDATHFTSFGTAKAWPFYVMFGNLSKYIRARPSSGSIHHLAYIPSLPDCFKDFAAEHHAKWKTQKNDILTHCRRELMHAVWAHILDEDFVHAYKYGMVIMCSDGIERRIYPRFFTYSADYPEKVLLATIRDKGLHPCPRCLVHKSKLDGMGMHWDMKARITKFRQYMADRVAAARAQIYRWGVPIKGKAVEDVLKEFSAVPTQNAFVERLGPDFNPSNMLVVDLLHEFELGVWKGLFTHLMRILYAAAGGSDELVNELDRRYRQISTFGLGTIRNFAENSSEMKKLAGRDFEDLLQCAIPVFEGLLPDEHNERVMKLLYRTAEWHGLAKMRLHTEGTLQLLEQLTKELGQLMREFRDLTCDQFNTKELPRETEARNRRNAKQHAKTSISSQAANDIDVAPALPSEVPGVPSAAQFHAGRKPKRFNLFTIKWHFLGDYVRHIRLFGTTDSYSTQLGELAHRLIKAFYKLTNKKQADKQIAQKYSRMNALYNKHDSQTQVELAEADQIGLQGTYCISKSRNQPVSIFSFVQDHDPAKERFLPKLQDHILGRLLGYTFDGDETTFTHEDRNTIRIFNNTIFRVNTIRVNYTTYDMRRSYDTINPRSHPFIMVSSPETEPDSHPFWYASVLGIFHTTVQHVDAKSVPLSPPQHIDFLWVRWLGVEPGHQFGRKQARLPKIGFVPETDEYAFGFLDPSLVIRGCHLLPSFVDGRTNELLSIATPTEARRTQDTDDWTNYYVGIFVDHDMLSHYHGGGIGHTDGTTSKTFHVDIENMDYPESETTGEEHTYESDNDNESLDSEPDEADDDNLSDGDVGFDEF